MERLTYVIMTVADTLVPNTGQDINIHHDDSVMTIMLHELYYATRLPRNSRWQKDREVRKSPTNWILCFQRVAFWTRYSEQTEPMFHMSIKRQQGVHDFNISHMTIAI